MAEENVGFVLILDSSGVASRFCVGGTHVPH